MDPDSLTLVVSVKKARLLGSSDEFHSYVTVKLQNVKSTTMAVRGGQPQWEQEFIFETNRPDESMNIELWSKGVLWDKLLGVALLPLHQVHFSAQPGAGQWLQIDAAPGEAELLQSRLDQLNRLQLEVDATLPPRAPLNHSGYSEDSDYTSDVSFPIHPNAAHPNSSVHQWDSHLHPHRQPHHRQTAQHDHVKLQASYEGDEDAYNETRLDAVYDTVTGEDYLGHPYDYGTEEEEHHQHPGYAVDDGVDGQHPEPNYAPHTAGRNNHRTNRDAEGRYDSYRSEDESTYKGEGTRRGYDEHYDSSTSYAHHNDHDEDPYGHTSEVEYHREYPRNLREAYLDSPTTHTPQSDYSRSVSASGRPPSHLQYDYGAYNGYTSTGHTVDDHLPHQQNGYREEEEERYISDGGKGYTADYDTYNEGASETMHNDEGRGSATWADSEPLSYNSRPPRASTSRTYNDRYDEDEYMNEEEEDRLRAEEEAEERVTIVEEPALKEKREKKELHDLWHWAYRQVCTNLGYKSVAK
ncbi:unnamed protein product, partial [Mesorhabditis spiculigera]